MSEHTQRLIDAAKRFLELHPVFRSKPLGAPGSSARYEQDMRIAAKDELIAAIAKAEGRS